MVGGLPPRRTRPSVPGGNPRVGGVAGNPRCGRDRPRRLLPPVPEGGGRIGPGRHLPRRCPAAQEHPHHHDESRWAAGDPGRAAPSNSARRRGRRWHPPDPRRHLPPVGGRHRVRVCRVVQRRGGRARGGDAGGRLGLCGDLRPRGEHQRTSHGDDDGPERGGQRAAGTVPHPQGDRAGFRRRCGRGFVLRGHDAHRHG